MAASLITIARRLAGADMTLWQPKRLAILAALGEGQRLSFSDLQRTTGITNGNLSAHLRRLEQDGLVVVEKKFVDRKPLTTVGLTGAGHAAVEGWIEECSWIVEKWKARREREV